MPTYRKYERQDTLKVNDDLGDRQTASDTDSPKNVVEALNSQQVFDRAQVAWLMQQAYRWGYEARDEEDRGFHAGYNARVAEENAEYAAAKLVFDGRSTTDWAQRQACRDEWDASAAVPRPGDFPGRGAEQTGLRVAA